MSDNARKRMHTNKSVWSSGSAWEHTVEGHNWTSECDLSPVCIERDFGSEAAVAQWRWYISKGLSAEEIVERFTKYCDMTFPS
jgi:hypothetical protein